MQKKAKYQLVENGSILILSTFLILAITMISVTYWKLIQMRIQMITQNQHTTKVFYAARAGLEDAIYEFRRGNSWDINEVHSDWIQENSSTFYKTNRDSSALDYFEYPVSFSVTVLGNINTGFVTINASASISNPENSRAYNKTLIATITRSFDNEIIIHSLTDQ